MRDYHKRNNLEYCREVLESKVEMIPECGCWILDGRTNHKRIYPTFSILGDRAIRAHRASWIIYNGSIPSGMNVCHRCDTPSCVNPNHLFLGTTKDNINDKVRKGRHAFGESMWMSKLTLHQVIKIIGDTRPYGDISKEYNVSKANICRIKKGHTWHAERMRSLKKIPTETKERLRDIIFNGLTPVQNYLFLLQEYPAQKENITGANMAEYLGRCEAAIEALKDRLREIGV